MTPRSFQESTAEIVPGDGESVLIIEDNKDLACPLLYQLCSQA